MTDGVMSAGENTYDHVGRGVVPGVHGGTLRPVKTSEAARELVMHRWRRKADAVRRGLARAGINVPGVEKPDAYAVVAAIAENHALNALDPSARGSAASARLVLEHGWPAPERASLSDAMPSSGLTMHLSADLARDLLDKLRQLKAGE